MTGHRLAGLEGTNPLGFLAAVGIQVAFHNEPESPQLWWSSEVVPRAMVDFSPDRISQQALTVFERWAESPAMNPQSFLHESGNRNPDDLKLKPEAIRSYIASAIAGEHGGELAMALVAEGSYDRKKIAKPSDLYFTAGQQKFLATARKILSTVTPEDVIEGLQGPWEYNSNVESLMWDVRDDRQYALLATNPATTKKQTNPGPEALAILGLSIHPVFGHSGRTLTQGCTGTWKKGWFSWPIWERPATYFAMRSILSHSFMGEGLPSKRRAKWLPAWSVKKVLRSRILRSAGGGYGTFTPPEIVWQK